MVQRLPVPRLASAAGLKAFGINQSTKSARESLPWFLLLSHRARAQYARCNVDAFPCRVSRDFPLFFPRRSAKESLCVSYTHGVQFPSTAAASPFQSSQPKNREATNE